jgi:eukaryotic-like serine/threonine-protein kinase
MSHPAGASRESKSSWELQQGDQIVPGRTAFKLLGGGKRFEAYLAWDDDLHALVVAKIVRPEFAEDPKAVADLAREADHLMKLNHPVIVRGFDAVLEGPRPHVLMEHLEGPHLSRLVRRYGSLAPEQSIPLALQLCSALHYLHRRELVHLDVKPRNVIMGAPPRLIDLSIMRTFEQAAALRSPLGTDAYMAPEQCDPSRAPVGPTADIFGIAATLYQAVTGRRPFPRPKDYDRGDPAQRFPQLDQAAAPFEGEVAPALGEVILRRLDPDPTKRGTAAQLALELEPFVAALPTRPVLGRRRPRI